jgi:hypothetical protein
MPLLIPLVAGFALRKYLIGGVIIIGGGLLSLALAAARNFDHEEPEIEKDPNVKGGPVASTPRAVV